jgi:Domain of unknown function DUF29
MQTDLYETDFYAWADQQAARLRAGDLEGADIAHIAAEIASLGRRERRELVNGLTVLLVQLLKWERQPTLRGSSWRASTANARDDLTDHLADNPSLRAKLGEAMEAPGGALAGRRRWKSGWRRARSARSASSRSSRPWTRISGRHERHQGNAGGQADGGPVGVGRALPGHYALERV